ncbi:unnamed protein product [Durusdinium trenchii]|uniref:Uncharacterized protein n=2 Tax=Durusdinium trenchii TaxID=1381693 RepID=A0ABP0NSV2_9DINO
MPGSAFMTAGRSACMNTSHRLAKDDQDFLASCPGNSPRPLAGRLGGICPGGQYWPPHYSAGRYQQKDTISSTRATHTEAAIKAPAQSFRDLTVHGWGHGTGYCPNTASIRGVDWAHKETTDVFRTTYNETMTSSSNSLASTWTCMTSPRNRFGFTTRS